MILGAFRGREWGESPVGSSPVLVFSLCGGGWASFVTLSGMPAGMLGPLAAWSAGCSLVLVAGRWRLDSLGVWRGRGRGVWREALSCM